MATVDETLSLEDIAAAQANLRQLMCGYWGARVLHVAVKLDLFNVLEAGPLNVATTAEKIRADVRATEMLLNACVALGLLEYEKEGTVTYKNSAVSAVFLVRSSEYYQGQLVSMYSDDWALWEKLYEAVRKGGPVGITPPFDNEKIRAMNDSASVTAPCMLKKLDLSRVHRVLDVGGGPATYSIAFARACPDAQITVLETPQGSQVTRDFVNAAGMSDRIAIETGDFLTDEFDREAYDLVLLSNIVHQLSTDHCRLLLKKSFEALASEGQCLVNDFLLRDDKTGPLLSTLFGLNMFLHFENGRTYSGWEITDYMQTEGFIRVQIVPLEPTPYSYVAGTRP